MYFPTKRIILILLALICTTLLFITFWKPALAFYHEQQAGEMLTQVIPTGDNDYGGFACLRPFITDPDQRSILKNALQSLAQTQTLEPDNSYSYYTSGRIHCLLGEYEQAVSDLQRYSELRPKNPTGLLEMGFALQEACPPNGKCETLNTYDVWKKAGVRAEDFVAMGEKARTKEDYAEALQWYQAAQRMGMELRSTIYYVKYMINIDLGKELEANNMLLTSVKLNTGWIDKIIKFETYLKQAQIYLRESEFQKAEKLLGVAYSINPLNLYVLLDLGKAYYYQGKLQDAQRMFVKASYIKTGDWQEAMAHRWLGETYLSMSLPEYAIIEFELAYKIFPGDISNLIRLGDVYVSLEDINKAHKIYLEAITLDPTNEMIKERMKIFKNEKP